jgi:hypothetical protein
MLPYVILGIILGIPVFFGLFFRVSASHLFFSVMTGELLGRYFGKDVEHFINVTFKNGELTHYAEALVVTLPIILTALFLKGSVSRTKGLLNFFPLIITSVVYAAFVLPVLPHNVQDIVTEVPLGQGLLNTSSFIVGGVVLIQLVALWLLNRGEGGSKGKRKRRKNKD